MYEFTLIRNAFGHIYIQCWKHVFFPPLEALQFQVHLEKVIGGFEKECR